MKPRSLIYALIIGLLVGCTPVEENAKDRLVDLLIPQGRHLLQASINDTSSESSDFTSAPRSLLIAFGHSDQTYSVSRIAENIVLPADAEGVWGDPFESLAI